jgi:hypothetical protein
MRSRVLLLLALTTTACSSSSSGPAAAPPCNENPWECPSTQTCWPEDLSTFECLNAGPGTLGTSCVNTVGTPTCGAGLACFQSVTSTTNGTCVAYCSNTDPSHACPGGSVCEAAALGGVGGPVFNICVSPNTGDDGGTTPETGAGDASSGG